MVTEQKNNKEQVKHVWLVEKKTTAIMKRNSFSAVEQIAATTKKRVTTSMNNDSIRNSNSNSNKTRSTTTTTTTKTTTNNNSNITDNHNWRMLLRDAYPSLYV